MGFDALNILGHAAILGTFVTWTTFGNDDNFHTFSQDLDDKCPANDMYSFPSILKIPLFIEKKKK